MKSIKFLAALALPAMFAACTNDDLVAVQEDMQQNVELVGADLIGTGVSMKIGSGVESRLSGTAWSTTDKLGLGWIVAGSYNSAQTENGELKDNALYANHMFECIGNNVFKTKGNLFKGWHFGYFPFEYMEEIGKVKKVEINPTQTEEWISDRYNTALYLSPREFLTADDLDKDYQLKDHVVYQLYRSVNTIGVTINPSTMFTGSDVLKDLAVKEIKLDAGQGIFYRQANVSPVNLSRIQYDEDGNYDGDKDKEEFFKALPTAFDFTDISAYKSIATKVENNGINMSGAQTLRIHTLPLKKTLSAENVQFTIKVEGGKFTVGYATGDELSAEEEHNNAAIEAFVESCAEEGALTVFPGILLLDLQLTGDMFEADFTSIKSEEEWNKAVKIANALEMEEVEFTIAAADEEGNNWAFMDVDGDGNLINLPEGDLTVKGEKMILGAEGEWPTEGLIVETSIDVNANLTVAGTMDVTRGNTITNKATIFAGAESSISTKDNSTLDNAEGRVIVEYGAYVYTQNQKEGTIAYVVKTAKKPEDIAKINTLISEENILGNAHVNTLIVKTTLDLCAKSALGSTVGDRYNSSTTLDEYLVSLKEINIELENGTIKGEQEVTKNVKSVEVISGTNTIKDINILNNLEVAEGAKVTIDATEHYHGTFAYKHEVKVGGDMINKGQVTATVDVRTTNIDNEKGKIVVNSGYTVWYKNVYIQGGIAQGKILRGAIDNASLKEAIENAGEGSEIVLYENVDYGTINVGELKNVTIKGGEGAAVRFVTDKDSKIENVTIKDIDFNFVTGAGQKNGAFVVIDKDAMIKNLVIENSTIVGDNNKNSYGIFGQNSNASIEIKNCNFSNLGYAIQTIAGGGYKSLTVDNCTFENIISWAIMPQYGYTGDLSVKGCNFKECKGGLIKTGAMSAGQTLTFINNTITNSTGHDGSDAKWFEINASAATKVINGNKKDGVNWIPGTAEGLN